MSPRNVVHTIRRAGVFTLGMFIMAFGIAMSIRANLGTGPVISLPTVLSFASPLSVGTLTIIFNLVMMAVAVAISLIARGYFPLFQLIQIPAAFLFGFFLDIAMTLTPWVDPGTYLMQWVYVVLSVIIIALGVHIEMKPRLTYIPADGVVALLAMVTPVKTGTIKMIFDWTLVIISTAVSLILLRGLEGVGEGTVFAAFGVGFTMRIIANIEEQFRVDRRYD